MKRTLLLAATIAAALALVFCGPPRVVEPQPIAAPVPMHSLPQDTTPKEEPRMVPAEAYMRTYLQLFGKLAPLEAQKRAKAGDGAQLFDTWDDYFAAMGFPDYRLDLPRGTQTNALMVSTFERVGVALCDRAVEHDIKGLPVPGAPKDPKAKAGPPPVNERVIFAFDAGDPADVAAFAPKFDVLHRTFLGYPASLAPTERTARFFALYGDVKKLHATKKTRFSPAEAGWAAVCYGLVRHPEFQLY